MSLDNMDGEAWDGFYRRMTARCEECGDCMFWTGAMTNKSVPVLCVAGKTSPIRRTLWAMLGRRLLKGMAIKASCGDQRCIAVGHLEQTRRGRPVGSKMHPAHRANIAEARRRASVLTWDDIAEIRATDRHLEEVSAEKGVGVSMLQKIRQGHHWKEALHGPFAGLLP